MGTKSKNYKTFDYYYDELSSNLADKKLFFYLNPKTEITDRKFYSEEVFLIAILDEVYRHVTGLEDFMFYVISNPTNYLSVLFNKYLNETNKIDEANNIVDSLSKLELNLIPLMTVKEEYDKEDLIKSYNSSIKSIIEIEDRLTRLEEGLKSYYRREQIKKKKDLYIS